MPPDRFDDVEFRIIDAPDPRPPRRRRWIAAGVAAILAAGALAAGASALTGGEDPAPKPPAVHHQYGHPWHHHGGCHRHDRDRGTSYAPDASKL